MSNNSSTAEVSMCAHTLERHELVAYPKCPFKLPTASDIAFLIGQRSTSRRNKDISFDPSNGRLSGSRVHDPHERSRLTAVLLGFSNEVTAWVKLQIPEYVPGLTRDRVTLRTQEEATRTTRLTARNDLLHIDHFPTRPSFGRRILRVFVNIDTADSHVWSVSEPFPRLLARFSAKHRLPVRTIEQWISPTQSVIRLFQGKKPNRSAFDRWMMKLHHFLKENHGFQTRAARKVHTFPPGSLWALFSDGLSHAQLRGRFALEHSFFVENDRLGFPNESPIALLHESTLKGKLGADKRWPNKDLPSTAEHDLPAPEASRIDG